MKKSDYFILIFLFFFCGKASAQLSLNFAPDQISFGPGPSVNTTNYLPISNYHFFNPYYYNPAMAGIEDKRTLSGDWNRQMDHSFLASYEQPISFINSAIGMHFSYTSDYYTSTRHFGLAYNYGFNIKDKGKLKLGFQFNQTSILIDESYIGFGSNDEKNLYNFPTMDIGLAFQVKQFRLGASVQNFFPAKITIAEVGAAFFTDVINGERQVNLSIANTFRLSEEWDWSLAALFRRNQGDNIHDLSSYLSFGKKYFIGTTFRTVVDHHWVGFVGVKIKEKVNLQFSFNAQKNEYDDHRFFESLVQYQFN